MVFNQPVFLYVENFLGFPVGGLVPAGWYDQENARWEAWPNGHILEVLSSEDGLAGVDVDGSGVAADAATLAELELTTGELRRLAELYEVGQTLWRAPVAHFTPIDHNWPYGPPEDSVAPPDPDDAEPDPDEDPDDDPEEDEDEPCERSGSIIECENQTLGERLAIVGTPYTLNYRSDRVPGRRVAYQFPLRLSGPEVPTSLKRIELVIDVAGRRFVESFAPVANLRHTFTWDGLDAYGRTVVEAARATARVAFVYPLTYLEPEPFVRSFSRFSASREVIRDRTSREVKIWSVATERSLGLWQAVGQALGGWTLSHHHTLDVDSGTVHFGDGSQLSNRSIATGYAMQGSLVEIDKLVEWMPDGTIYGVEHLPSEDWIWELRPDGSTRLRHTTDYRRIRDLAVAEDGTIYYTTTGCSSSHPGFLRRVNVRAAVWMPAENLATWPEVVCPQGLELSADGSLLIFDQDRLLTLSSDGNLSLYRVGVRGGGLTTARTVRGPDGGIYFSEPTDARVRRIGRDGSFSVVAGTGVRGFSGDGGPATQAQLSNPSGLAIDRLGRLLIADSGNHRIRRVGADGVIDTIIGNGGSYAVMPDAEGTPSLAATLPNPKDLAVAADGTLYINSSDQVVRVRAPILPLRELSYLVAGRNGRELYAFDASGRHLRTMHAQTNATLLEFEYDAAGRLTAVVDAVGERTVIEREADGRPRALVAPSGARTRMDVDGTGYLDRVVRPDGSAFAFEYRSGGLLTRIDLPGERFQTFDYSAAGRLVKDVGPAGNASRISRRPAARRFEVDYVRDRQLTGIVQPSGRSVALTYATSGQLRDLVIPEGSYRYDFSGTTGNMSSIRAPDGGVVSLEYDGFLHTASTWSGAVSGRVERGYDANFWVDSIRVNGVEVDYAYDRDGLLTRAGDLSLTRHPDHGSVTATQLGRVSTQLAYDGFGDMQSLVAAVDGVDRFVEEVERDAAGRIVEKRERVDGVDVIYGYSYDLRGRLESVTREGAPWMSYGYDANGNRLRQVSGGVETGAVYDERDRLLSSAGRTFVHGVDGDLQSMSEGGFTVIYDHDVLGHLRGATLDDGRRIEYLLDAANRRVGKRIDGVLVQGFLYDGALRLIAELDGANNVVGRFVYAGRAHVPDYVIRADGTYRIVSDHLGSPRLVVNVTSGEVVQRMDYDPFGVVTLDAGTVVQPIGFAGGLYDRHTGLVHFGNREYDPRQGRWTTIDPILFAGRDTNLYAYVGSDPVNFIDPLGWEKFPADPSGLSEEWTHDPSHKYPHGERYRRPNGDYIDFHKGRPGQTGQKGKDHWHYNKPEDQKHYKPGEEIPEGEHGSPAENPSEFCLVDDPSARPIPPWVGITAGVGLIAATLAQDVATGGLGLLDDPATIGLGVALIVGTVTLGETPAGGGEI